MVFQDSAFRVLQRSPDNATTLMAKSKLSNARNWIDRASWQRFQLENTSRVTHAKKAGDRKSSQLVSSLCFVSDDLLEYDKHSYM
jgi:hypothetical protein